MENFHKLLNDYFYLPYRPEHLVTKIREALKDYNFDEIYEMNKKYKEVRNKNELFDLIYYDFFESKEKEIKFDGNYIIINNKEINKEIKLKKIKFNEDDIFNDIFNKLSSLENQVNQFTQNGQNLRTNLENNLEKIEYIIKNINIL